MQEICLCIKTCRSSTTDRLCNTTAPHHTARALSVASLPEDLPKKKTASRWP